MDIVSSWAMKLAEEVASDEVDLAPAITDAFIKGGKDRKELFETAKGGTLGAFGPGEMLIIFPLVLQGVARAAPALMSLFSSGSLNQLLEAVKNALDLKERFQHKPTDPLPPALEQASLRQSLTTISNTLSASGLSQDQADLLTFRVLRAFLEQPQSAMPFIQKVAEKQ